MSKFFVTTTYSNDPHCRGRCIGYFDTLKEAVKVATSSPEFFCEAGYYDLVVIEEIKPGVYSYCSPEKQLWYKFTEVKGKLVAKKIENPYKSTVGWAIG
jgi:hypothetical protein